MRIESDISQTQPRSPMSTAAPLMSLCVTGQRCVCVEGFLHELTRTFLGFDSSGLKH